MIYFHPWEVARTLPWRSDARLRALGTRYPFRRRTRSRVQRLLSSVTGRAGSMHETLRALEPLPAWHPRETAARAV